MHRRANLQAWRAAGAWESVGSAAQGALEGRRGECGRMRHATQLMATTSTQRGVPPLALLRPCAPPTCCWHCHTANRQAGVRGRGVQTTVGLGRAQIRRLGAVPGGGRARVMALRLCGFGWAGRAGLPGALRSVQLPCRRAPVGLLAFAGARPPRLAPSARAHSLAAPTGHSMRSHALKA